MPFDRRSNRELRHKKLVDDTLARHGVKRKTVNAHRMERLREAAEGEAEELLDAQVRPRGDGPLNISNSHLPETHGNAQTPAKVDGARTVHMRGVLAMLWLRV